MLRIIHLCPCCWESIKNCSNIISCNSCSYRENIETYQKTERLISKNKTLIKNKEYSLVTKEFKERWEDIEELKKLLDKYDTRRNFLKKIFPNAFILSILYWKSYNLLK